MNANYKQLQKFILIFHNYFFRKINNNQKLLKRKSSILIILLLTTYNVFAQKESYYKLSVVYSSKSFQEKNNIINYKKIFSDSLSLKKELNNVLQNLYELGYLSASFDSIKFEKNIANAYLNTGNKYHWAQLSFINFDKPLQNRIGINPQQYHNKPLKINQLQKLQEKIINYYENNGYPFASLKIDCIEYKNDSISGILKINPSVLVTIDSIFIKGNAKISPFYLQNYLGIKQNDIYNENTIKNIGNRIKELQFIKEIRNYEIEFAKNKASVFLYLDNKKANQFNGIIGVLPNDKTSGKVLVTGEVNLFLQNSFGKGETILFDWKKLEKTSQDLNAKFNYPFIFKLPLGIDVDFSLLKKDTIYLTVNTNLGLQFLLQSGNYIKAFIENKTTSLISTKGFETITVLPDYSDADLMLYGIGYNDEHFDYKFNPRKGYSIKFIAGAGEKHIRKNSKINPDLYANTKLYSTQGEGKIELVYFLPVTEKTSIKFQNKSGYIYNKNLFENELFRLGGLKTIRGFNENTFQVSSYSIMSVEYRLIFEQNSCAYLFWDGAYYEKNTVTKFISDFPYGFGAGIDFETKAGIFSVNYALGKQFNNPIDLRAAKIHFGYINRF